MIDAASRTQVTLVLGVALLSISVPVPAAAQSRSTTPARTDPVTVDVPNVPASTTAPAEPDARIAREIESAPPPPTSALDYVQYGVAFAAEQVITAGAMCDAPGAPCILGTGGGIVVRGGWRGSGPIYLGAAYELTKQDPNKLYRIALLQQARAEGRYYLNTSRVTEPYLGASAGLAGYGNEWDIDTWGPGGSFGVGIEYQISRRTMIGAAIHYRLLYFQRFTDTAGTNRDPGLAQLFGLDLVLEQRDSLVRERDRRP